MSVDSGLHVCGFRTPHPWIPDSINGISWIPGSTGQNYLDSGFWFTLHGAISSRHKKNKKQKTKNKKKTALWPESRSVRPQIFVRVSYLRHPSWLKDEI